MHCFLYVVLYHLKIVRIERKRLKAKSLKKTSALFNLKSIPLCINLLADAFDSSLHVCCQSSIAMLQLRQWFWGIFFFRRRTLSRENEDRAGIVSGAFHFRPFSKQPVDFLVTNLSSAIFPWFGGLIVPRNIAFIKTVALQKVRSVSIDSWFVGWFYFMPSQPLYIIQYQILGLLTNS